MAHHRKAVLQVRSGIKNCWPNTSRSWLYCKTFTMRPAVMRCSSSFREWTLPVKMGQCGTSCPGSTRRVVRSLVSNSPAQEELNHDFLWRSTCRLPERGRIGIFNRSYYEEVLVVRVHPEILASQRLSEELRDDKSFWKERYRSIVDLERHLFHNSTRTIKIFLHLSKEEQRKRFLERIDEPDKNWKFSLADIHERTFWKQYVAAYEECLSATSTHHAPWYVVPADDKENARLIVSRIIIDAFEELKMEYPKTTPKREDELKAIRKLLVAESPNQHGRD